MIDPTRNGARSQIKPDLGSAHLLNPAPNASLEPTGFYESSRWGRLFDDHLGIFDQQGMIEVQTSEAQGRRILMFFFHNSKLLLDIFRDADPGRRCANKRGSARGRGNSVNRRKRSCRYALPPEKTVKSRGFLGQCSWWCSLGQLCKGKSSCSVIVWNS